MAERLKGTFRCRIERWGMSQGQTGNRTPFFWTTFLVLGRVTDPENPEKDEPLPAPARREMRRFLSPKTVKWFAADMKKLGFTGTSIAELDPTDEKAHDFEGFEFVAECGERQAKNGKGEDVTYEDWSLPRTPPKLAAGTVKDLSTVYGETFAASLS